MAVYALSYNISFEGLDQKPSKKIADVRRRCGLTHQEYRYYHTLVHGQKLWNAPKNDAFPLAYPLDHVFDAAFGANDSVPNQIYIGRDGVAELYGNLTGPSTAPANNYSSTVIGSDGADFNDFSVSFSAVAHEVPVTGFSHIHRPKHEPDGPGEINDFLCAVATKESTSKHSPEQSRMHFLKRFWSRQFTTLAFTCPSLEKIRGVISVALICPLSVLS